ncbi:hypothetical protein OSTOST_05592, partial [Ostertagia ostertagi]
MAADCNQPRCGLCQQKSHQIDRQADLYPHQIPAPNPSMMAPTRSNRIHYRIQNQKICLLGRSTKMGKDGSTTVGKDSQRKWARGTNDVYQHQPSNQVVTMLHSVAVTVEELRWRWFAPRCSPTLFGAVQRRRSMESGGLRRKQLRHIDLFLSALKALPVPSLVSTMSSILSVVSKFKGRKRGLVDFGSPQASEQERALVTAIDQFMADDATPSYMKTIIEYLLEAKERLEILSSENKELTEEVHKLRKENDFLRQSLSQPPQSQVIVDTSNSETQVTSPVKKGTYIRPSLPQAERDKLRTLRLAARAKPVRSSAVVNSNVSPQSGLNSAHKSMDVSTLIRCDRPRKVGGGVAILAKKEFLYQVIFKETIIDSYEILCCDFSLLSELCRIAVVYRAPSCSHNTTQQLFKAITDLSICQHPFLAMGDFNMPEVNWQSEVDYNFGGLAGIISRLCASYNLQQLVEKPTRGTHVLDLLFCNRSDIVSGVLTGPPLGSSDHFKITFLLSFPKRNHLPTFRRQFAKADYTRISNYLANVDWFGSFQCCNTVHEMYELFIFVLKHTIEMFVPVCEVHGNRPSFPEYLLRFSKTCSQAWMRAIESKEQDDMNNYLILRNRFLKKLMRYNLRVEKKVINSCNKTAFYKMLSTKLKNRGDICTLKDAEGNLAFSDQSKAELLAKHFASVYAGSCPDHSHSVFPSLARFPLMNQCVWFQEEEILDCIKKWPSSSSLTPDGVSLYFLKRVSNVI